MNPWTYVDFSFITKSRIRIQIGIRGINSDPENLIRILTAKLHCILDPSRILFAAIVKIVRMICCSYFTEVSYVLILSVFAISRLSKISFCSAGGVFIYTIKKTSFCVAPMRKAWKLYYGCIIELRSEDDAVCVRIRRRKRRICTRQRRLPPPTPLGAPQAGIPILIHLIWIRPKIWIRIEKTPVSLDPSCFWTLPGYNKIIF